MENIVVLTTLLPTQSQEATDPDDCQMHIWKEV